MKRIIKIFFSLVSIAILLYFVKPYYDLYELRSKRVLKFNSSSETFKISEEVPLSKLDSVLITNELMDSAYSLKSLIKFKNYDDDTLVAGKYTLQKIWSANTLVNQIFLMRNQNITDLHIPSCRNLKDLAIKIAEQTDLTSEVLINKFNDPLTHQKYGFNSVIFSTFFLPTTLEIYKNTTADNLLDLLAKNYKKFWNDSRLKKANKLNLKPSEITVLASIVQLEQQSNFDEHTTIAGLYLNRLKLGMKLQADPTVKYALNNPRLKRVLNKHLKVDSPYNTYLHHGLPPGAIYIPETSVIDAVLNYQEHDYLFMCAYPSYNANHSFAISYKDHLKNQKKYTDWLDKEGIR